VSAGVDLRVQTRSRSWVLAVALLAAATGLAGCAVEPNDANLTDSFVAQIESVGGVTNLTRDGETLSFSGPDGQGGTARWEVRIDGTELVTAGDLQGHVRSTWIRDGTPLDPPVGSMSFMPVPFLEAGIAQDCYAIWNDDTTTWGWT